MTRQKKTWLTAGAILALLLLTGIGWAMARREDPDVTKVRELQAKAFSRETEPGQRRELFEKMRSESEKLTETQRNDLRTEMRQNHMVEMRKRMQSYFAMNEDDRIAHLDERIDEMEKRRSGRQNEGEGRGRRNGGPPDRSAGGAKGGEGGARGGARGGGPGGRRNATPEQRNERRRGFLSHTSATDRAQFSAYIEDLNERREARGLDPTGPFRGGPRRGGNR